jgi:4-diphosphocytidyl-2-C-methyl-D-erythritol kinase
MTGRHAAGSAPAKVNLALHVLAREESGFHQLETIFCALDLADELEIELHGNDIELHVHGADLGDVRGNLVYRAATAYFAAIDAQPGARIRLQKRVPHGAGLGGGSSDAATTLRLLDVLHGAPLGVHRLLRLASTLGADVPFFATGEAMALAWGRGERLLPLPAPDARDVLLVVPDKAMPTAYAYAELARRRGRGTATPAGSLLDHRLLGSWSGLARLARNDFENIAFEHVAGLAEVKQRLREHGAAPALLAGSGSAVFGVFERASRADAAAEALAGERPEWRVLRTRTATMTPDVRVR